MLQNTSAIDSMAQRTADHSTTSGGGGVNQLITSTPFQNSGNAYSSKKATSNVRRRIVPTPAPSTGATSDGDNDGYHVPQPMTDASAMLVSAKNASTMLGSVKNTPGKLNFFSKINTNCSTPHSSKRAPKNCPVPQFALTKLTAMSGTEQQLLFCSAAIATTFHSSTTSFVTASNCLSNPCGDGYTTAPTTTAAATASANVPQHLGKSDRMSKEKQKFFRHSAFNSDRIAKTSPPQAMQPSPTKSTARSSSSTRTKMLPNCEADAFRSGSVAGNQAITAQAAVDWAKLSTGQTIWPESSGLIVWPDDNMGPCEASSDSSSSDDGSDDDSDDSDDDSTTSSSSSDDDSDESTPFTNQTIARQTEPQRNLSSHASDDDSDDYSTTSSNSTSSDDDDDDDETSEIQMSSTKKMSKKQPNLITKSSGNDSSSASSLHKRHAGSKESTWGFAAEAKKSFDIFQRASSSAVNERVFGNFDGVDKETLVKVSNSSFGDQKPSSSKKAPGQIRGLFDSLTPLYATNNFSRSKQQDNEPDYKMTGRRKTNKGAKGAIASANAKDGFKETGSTFKGCDGVTTPSNTVHPKKTDFTKFLNAKNSSHGTGGSGSSNSSKTSTLSSINDANNEEAKQQFTKKFFAQNSGAAGTSKAAAASTALATNSLQHHNNNNINNKNKNNNHQSNNNAANNNNNNNNNQNQNQKSKAPRRIALMSLPLDPKNVRYNSSSDDEIPYLTTPRNSNHIKSLNSNAVQNARCKQLNSSTTTSSNANSNSVDSQLLFGFTNSNSQSLDFASLRETSGCLNSIPMSSNYPMLSSLSPHTPPYNKNQSMGKDQNQTNQKKTKNSSTTLYTINHIKFHRKKLLFETKKKCRKVC